MADTPDRAHDDTLDAPWLDDDEMEAWLAMIRMMARLPGALDRQLRRDADLTAFEYQVLVGLSEADGHCLRMSELAAFTEGALPRLSQVAARLEQRGMITRGPDPDDGRYTQAVLTDAGMAKLVTSAPGHVATVRRLVFDPLTRAQVRQLRDISQRIGRSLDDEPGC